MVPDWHERFDSEESIAAYRASLKRVLHFYVPLPKDELFSI